MSSSPQQYPHTKANLTIQGNLNEAQDGWSMEELNYQHRIVVFNCSRIDNNSVLATFSCVSPSAAHIIKHEGLSHINCLYSRATNKHFFIGTDALTAVERMLGVELGESGRKGLRNKFDSYGPITARNSKDNLSDIFSLIKNNERLRPRNVEKGVRIYRWEELAHFLQGMARHIDLRPLESSAFLEPNSNHPYTEVAGWHSTPEYTNGVYQQAYSEMNGLSNIQLGTTFDIAYSPPLYEPVYGQIATAPQYTTAPTMYMHAESQPAMYNFAYDPAMMHQQHLNLQQHPQHHQAWQS